MGLRDKATQKKLLQEPPNSLDDTLLIARRFEAANATMKTLAREAVERLNKVNKVAIRSVNSLNATKTWYSCNGFGHASRQWPTMHNFRQNNSQRPQAKLCYLCQKPGHLAKSCPLADQQPANAKSQVHNEKLRMDKHLTVCYRCGNSGHIAKFCNANLEGDLGPSRETDKERAKKNESKIRLSTVSSPSKRKPLWWRPKLMGKTSFV